MLQKDMDGSVKIPCFNRWLRRIVKHEQPDVLVLCTFYMNEFTTKLEGLSMSCRYRFDISVDVFHMSNLYIDANDTEQFSRIITNSIYWETVSKTVKNEFRESSIPIFNGLASVECDKMYEVNT